GDRRDRVAGIRGRHVRLPLERPRGADRQDPQGQRHARRVTPGEGIDVTLLSLPRKRIGGRLGDLGEGGASPGLEWLGLASNHEDRVLVVRPGAVRVDGYGDSVLDGLESMLEERIRTDSVRR